MLVPTSMFTAALSLFASLAQAAPVTAPVSTLTPRGFNCASPVAGLNQADCQYMSSLGLSAQGINARSANGVMWLDQPGPNRFTFLNAAAVPVTLIMWNMKAWDFEAPWLNKRLPQISYSLNPGGKVNVFLANGVSGGFAGLYGRTTGLHNGGMISNTWGEFTTGDDATADISREVNMRGNGMRIKVDTGCEMDMERCSYKCKWGLMSCWEAGDYELVGCERGSQKYTNKEMVKVPHPKINGATIEVPEGGCQGWSGGGGLTATFLP